MQQGKLIFVLNKNAGTGEKQNLTDLILSFCKTQNINFKIFLLPEKNAETDLKKLIRDFNPFMVVAVGGDGTCNFAGNVLAGTEIILGIIPVGSANGLATCLNIPGDPEEALQVLKNGTIKKTDGILVNNEIYCFHLGDIGLNAKIIRRFEEENNRGMWGYVKHVIREYFLSRSHRFLIETDNKLISKKGVALTFANGDRYGTGAVINPGGKMDDGIFEIAIIKKIPITGLPEVAIRFWNGTLDKSRFVNYLKCTEAKIKVRKKIDAHCDGEMLGKHKELSLKIIPRILNIITPRE